jgi:2-oxoglutarate ferredoxin oxidoreductase subunit gamma
MSQPAYVKYGPTMAAKGALLIDDSLVTPEDCHRADVKVCGLPATTIAQELGNQHVANSVMLGFWTAVVNVVRREAMHLSLAESVPSKTVELNRKAFEIGYEAGCRAGGGSPARPPLP